LYRPENKGLLSSLLVKDFAWDELSADSVWAFGPASSHANMLLDYTIEGETDKTHLEACRNSITQGFQWATREGPLCEEPMKNVKFKIVEGFFAAEPVHRSTG